MKTNKLDRLIQILASLGVISGIIFLVIEIRQNNELMEAEARFNRLSLSTEAFNLLSSNGELAEIMVKLRNNEELTEIEEYRATMVIRRWLANMEWMFREMPLDSPERSYAEQSLTALSSEPLRRQVFEDNKNNFEANFVIWIENNIINQ
jgi:hypothetical protein